MKVVIIIFAIIGILTVLSSIFVLTYGFIQYHKSKSILSQEQTLEEALAELNRLSDELNEEVKKVSEQCPSQKS